MTRYYSNNPDHSGPPIKKRRNPWITALKAFCWIIGILVVLAGIAVWIISYYVSPDRIIRIIEDKSSEYMQAEVKIGKLQYKFFSTYPWLNFEVDSLAIISKSLESVPADKRALLPFNSDSLAFVKKLKGQINFHSLLHDDINIRGIEIVQPKINLVVVSESVSNFNIAPEMKAPSKIPSFRISEIEAVAPLDISFFSLADDVDAKLEVEKFYLTQNDDKKTYGIGFEGLVDGHYQTYTLPSQVPLKFNTDLRLNLPSVSLKLENVAFSLAGLAVLADGEVFINPNGIDLKKANFNVKIDDIFTLIKYLPLQISEMIPLPEGLTGYLPLDVSVSLRSPIHLDTKFPQTLSLDSLPSLITVVKIENADLSFLPPHAKKIKADDIYLEVVGDYNNESPEDAFIQIKELRMKGEGITLTGQAYISNIMGEQQNVTGDFFFQSPLMESISYLIPNSGFKIAGILKGELDFNAQAENLGKEGIKNIKISGDLLSNSLKLNSSSTGDLRLKNLKSDFKAHLPSYPLNDYSGTKLDLDIMADSVALKNSSMNLFLSALNFRIDAMDTVSGTPDPYGSIILKLGDLKLDAGKTQLSVQNIDFKADGNLKSTPSQSNYKTVAATTPGNDALIASRVDHTPLVVEYNGGCILQTILGMVNMDADLQVTNAYFNSPAYLLPVSLSNIDLSTNLNRVRLSASDLTLGRTSCGFDAEIDGIGTFLTSYSATPLKANAQFDFSNVDINQLSWGYFGALIAQGQSPDTVFFAPPMTPFTAADSVCVAIPRNIDASIRLNSQAAEYMQYRFSPLSTEIIVKGGAATLSKLTVGAPYCTAVVDWTYSTSSLDNIFMDLKADVKNFSFSPFYEVFPQLTDKAPELKNFTGVINADIGCRFLMFPSMFMNSESLTGSFDIKGSDMEFARSGKIEKITHLMLIEGDAPIHIQNMNITGSYHDNILELNPFKIRFDEYQLSIGGINNTAGDMYYHIALEKSPFHLPFGVNLFGKFKHPEVRVGGPHMNDFKSEMISPAPDNKIDVNIMAYLKHGWLLFTQIAAKYEQEKEGKD